MSITAIVTMVLTMVFVTSIAVYFFYKVLVTPPKAEPDSYQDNN